MKLRDYFENNKLRIFYESKRKHQVEAHARVEKFIGYKDMGSRDLSSIKANDVFLFIDHLVTTLKLSNATVNRYRAAILKVLRAAHDDDEMPRYLRVVKLDESKNARLKSFTQDEVDKIITYLRYSRAPHMADMCILSLHTGMRLGEIVSLGLEAELLMDGEGDPYIFLPTTKNGDSREVYLSDDAFKAARNLVGFYFSEQTFYDVWHEMKRKLGVQNDKDFTFHTFRHTAATYMANDLNFSAPVIASVLGHRNLKTTQRYIKVLPVTKKEVAKGMMRHSGTSTTN